MKIIARYVVVKIRLWGTPEEVKEFAEYLERTPCVKVLQRSEGYPDRGKSAYERVYIEAKLRLPEKKVTE